MRIPEGFKTLILQFFFVALVIVVWEFSYQYSLINRFLFAEPVAVATSLVGIITAYSQAFRVTLTLVMIAFGLGAFVGIALGLLIGSSEYLYSSLDPYIMVIVATPKIVLFPLFILWFGIGATTAVLFGAFHSFYTIMINTMGGLRSLPRTPIIAAKAMGATGLQVYEKVVLPGIMPSVLGGLRLGWRGAIIGVLLAEIFTPSSGVGALIFEFGNRLKPAELYATALAFATITALGYFLLLMVEKRVDDWRL